MRLFKLVTLFSLLFCSLSYAQSGTQAPLEIATIDNTVDTWPYKLKVSNGTLTNNGNGTDTLTISGGGGSYWSYTAPYLYPTTPTNIVNLTGNGLTGAVTYYGSNLNDMTTGGSYTGFNPLAFIIEIDSTGFPDTFEWSTDGGTTFQATGVSITGSAQILAAGITVTFASTTGHTLGDQWFFPVARPAVELSTGSSVLTDDGSYPSDPLAGLTMDFQNGNMIMGQYNLLNFIPGISASYSNVAIGLNAMYEGGNIVADVAIGQASMYNITNGLENVALGTFAGYYISSGSDNVAIGYNALNSTTTGTYNTAIGFNAIAQNNFDVDEFEMGANAVGNGSYTMTFGDISITDNYFQGNIHTTGTVSALELTDGTATIAAGNGTFSGLNLTSATGTELLGTSGTNDFISYTIGSPSTSLSINTLPGSITAEINTVHPNLWKGTQTFSTSAPVASGVIWSSTQAAPPTIPVNGCGTIIQGTFPIAGPPPTDEAGTITTGTVAGSLTTCTIKFGQAHTSPPQSCMCNDQTSVIPVTASNFTVTGLQCNSVVSIASMAINYTCKWTAA